MSVVTIEHVTPPPRYDNLPWTKVRWEESLTSAGPWIQIEEQTFSPVDTDPSLPAERSFTTEEATLDAGWYRLIFVDATNDTATPTTPVHNVTSAATAIKPSVNQLGALLRARTLDDDGNEIGTFNDETRPTRAQAEQLINTALDLVVMRTGTNIPEKHYQRARAVVLLLAAQLVETTYYPEQAGQDQSAANLLGDMYSDGLRAFELALRDDEATTAYGRLTTIPIFGREGDAQVIPIVDASDVAGGNFEY